MSLFAVLNYGVVVNTIVADSKSIAEEVTNMECIEYTYDTPVGIGYTYDGSTFSAPVTK